MKIENQNFEISQSSTPQNNLFISKLGSLDKAFEVFKGMMRDSSAYREKITQLLGSDIELEIQKAENSPLKKQELLKIWEKLPLLNKKNFYGVHEWSELLAPDSFYDIYSIYRSSGTTQSALGNKGFFWPQSRKEDREAIPEMQTKLVEAFKLKEKRTLVIIGLSLGSWAGGEQFSFLFKNLSLMEDLPMVVFSPGNQHSEIIEIISRRANDFDQILVAFCTSAIFYMHKLAEQSGIELPWHKITYVVTGECFPEQFRLDLKKKAGQSMAHLTILSIYGSADTGFIGFESLPLIRMRQFLNSHPEVAVKFGFAPHSIPNLFHVQVEDALYESIEGELVMTKERGLPLVRYNLQDRVDFFSWKTACLMCAEAEPKSRAFWQNFANLPMTDFISVAGRTSGCVFLCESIIYETMLQDVFLQSSLSQLSTSVFVVWTENIKGQQVLCWQVELKEGVAEPTPAEVDVIYAEFIKLMSEQHSVFQDDYESLYRPFEGEGLRVFKFFFSPNSHLSEHPMLTNSYKRKMIVPVGPI